MVRVGVAVLLIAGCSGAAPAVRDAGASPDGADGCDPYAQSNAPYAPCATDSDCHNGFLACVRSTVSVCRDANPATTDAGCLPPSSVDVPVCPATAEVAVTLCSVRYQISCGSDQDCGPAGFVCANGTCDGSGHETVCAATTDCPAGWDCYEACACPGAAPGQKRCYPPFSQFSCPACGPIMDPTDGAAN